MSMGEGVDYYNRMERKRRKTIAVILLSLILLFFISLMVGHTKYGPIELVTALLHKIIPAIESTLSNDNLLINVRLPRALVAVLVGMSLGTAGAVMQNTLRNPLVSPFTLGLSSASAFGATLMIVMMSEFTLPAITLMGSNFSMMYVLRILAAFGMGVGSMLIVLYISKFQRMSNATMILAGVILSYLFEAGIMMFKYIATDSQLRDITVWLMGGFGESTWAVVIILVPTVTVCLMFLINYAAKLNILANGDDVARNLGVDVPKLKRNALLLSTFAVALCISFTGIIGFVGLMAPHICSMIIGNDNRYLLPCSGMLGAVLLLASDTVGRVIADPMEIPVGVIMYILGGAFFMFLVFKGKWRSLS